MVLNKVNQKKLLEVLPLSLMLTILFGIFISFKYIIDLKNKGYTTLGLINELLSLKIFLLGFLIFLIIYLIVYLIRDHYDSAGKFIYRYRYLIAISSLIFLVLLKINGSSIGYWSNILPGGSDDGLIFGVNRAIRSDEWALNTPMAISQFLNPDRYLPYFNDIFRGVKTDMFIIYGQPVWDLAGIFRPFHWGYIFLGMERGLSFFWYGRLIALILVTFEFLQLFTQKNKLLSLSGALLIALSSLVSWWFAVNGLIELLIFGQLAIICIYTFFTTNKTWLKIILMIVFSICAGGYILVFYPAWQIALFYLFLPLLIGLLVLNRSKLHFLWKKDLVIIIIGLAVLAIGLFYVFQKSWDTIDAVLNTVYPGSRVDLGGYDWKALFRYPISLYFPIIEPNVLGNASEMSTIYTFFPLGLLLSLWVIFKDKKRDPVLIALLVSLIIISSYYFIGMPKLLADITLLSKAYFRSFLGISLINLFLLIRSITLMKKLEVNVAAVLSISLTIIVVVLNVFLDRAYFLYWMLPGMLIVSLISFYSILRKNYKLLFIPVILIAFSGILVNPVRQGSGVVEKNVFLKEISSINTLNRGLWIVEGLDYPGTNMLTLAGASTLNSTSVYPNLDSWEKIDPKGEYSDIYNRYAHIKINLVEGPSNFKLDFLDSMIVNLSYSDIKTLGIKYIVTTKNLNELNIADVELQKIYSYDEYKIYQIIN